MHMHMKKCVCVKQTHTCVCAHTRACVLMCERPRRVQIQKQPLTLCPYFRLETLKIKSSQILMESSTPGQMYQEELPRREALHEQSVHVLGALSGQDLLTTEAVQGRGGGGSDMSGQLQAKTLQSVQDLKKSIPSSYNWKSWDSSATAFTSASTRSAGVYMCARDFLFL